MVRQMIYHDLVINNTICNLKCVYCEGVNFANEKREVSVRELDIQNINKLVRDVLELTSAPILKISGGELFIYENAVTLIKSLSPLYKHIQVATNGTLITNEIIDDLAKVNNLSLNVSLDGHTAHMNSMRFYEHDYSKHVLGVALYSIEKQIPIELTSVITNSNYKNFFHFLTYLTRLTDKILVVPIPVRGKKSKELFSVSNRLNFANMFITRYSDFSFVLPCKSYCKSLIQTLQCNFSKKQKCFIPIIALQIFSNGKIFPCPIGWTSPVADLFSGETNDLFDFSKGIYNVLINGASKVSMCIDCFSSATSLNLFLHGKTDIEELSCFPMFRNSEIRNITQIICDELNELR